MLVAVFFVLAIIPLMYAGMLTESNVDPFGKLHNIDAVIVNSDQGADVNSQTGVQHLNLGDQIVSSLIPGKSSADSTGTATATSHNFTWHTASASKATDGLSKGTYLAELVIPSNFTAETSSNAIAKPTDTSNARTAHITIKTNDSVNYIIGVIAQNVASTLQEQLSSSVQANYLNNIYLNMTTLHGSMQTAAAGANTLNGGSAQLTAGASNLSQGLSTISQSTSALPQATAALKNGADKATSGSTTLSQGARDAQQAVSALAAGSSKLSTGTQTLAAGLQSSAQGSQALETGTSTAASGMITLKQGSASALQAAQQLKAGSNAALTGAQRLDAGINGTTGLKAVLANLSANLSKNTSCMADAQCQTDIATLNVIATKLGAGVSALSGSTNNSGLTALDAGMTQLVGVAGNGSPASSTSGATGLTALNAGIAAASTGITTIDQNQAKLAAGLSQLHDGASQAHQGAQQLGAGLATLNAKMPAMTSGTQTLNTGLHSLSNGLASLNQASGTLTVSLKQAASGASTLQSGAQQLQSGTGSLSAGLANGTSQIPSYTGAQAKAASTAASKPLAVNTQRVNKVDNLGTGFEPYFLTLGLLIGTLVLFVMRPPLREKFVRQGRPAFIVWIGSFVPYALFASIQAVLTVCIIQFGVGIDAVNLPGLFAFAIFTSLTFLAINQAITALFGDAGKFVMLVLMVTQITSSGATYPLPTAPGFFRAVGPYLPFTQASRVFRVLIAGGGDSYFIGQAVPTMLIWMACGLALSLLCAFIVTRRERNKRPFMSVIMDTPLSMSVLSLPIGNTVNIRSTAADTSPKLAAIETA